MRVSDPNQYLAATDLDKLRGTAPPPLCVLGPGACVGLLEGVQYVMRLPQCAHPWPGLGHGQPG